MKKVIVGILLLVMGLLMVGCNGSKIRKYNPNAEGDVFQQNVKGNIVDGYQWEYEIKNGHISLTDDMVNFYDLESKTEVGDFFYFFNAVSEGDDELIFKLVDTKTKKVYCELKYTIKVDANNKISLTQSEIKDKRTNELQEYTYDEPEVRFQGEEH